ncbi:recombinase family protein [Geomonas sp. RF6]|uniref:recombinase family protein n=1 Tax=Geomonas sp. RF6 TaxID=2897342 RepID=UPI001E434D6A|nr:recombinase family protein [Geomonas sp. RF6]UFS71377.1 recombinase family protein [Geomonas sp. RF6]
MIEEREAAMRDGKIIGYARVSTTEQHLEVQLEQLKAAGCSKIFSEKKSGVDAKRVQLASMLDYVREGDQVVCCKLDRIARSTQDLLNIVDVLTAKGVSFKILNINLDTGTPTGKLMLTMLGAIATFEREMMLERQREGIAKAKAQGKYKGRVPTARAKSAEVLQLLEQGKTKNAIAVTLGIGVASVYRIAKAARG